MGFLEKICGIFHKEDLDHFDQELRTLNQLIDDTIKRLTQDLNPEYKSPFHLGQWVVPKEGFDPAIQYLVITGPAKQYTCGDTGEQVIAHRVKPVLYPGYDLDSVMTEVSPGEFYFPNGDLYAFSIDKLMPYNEVEEEIAEPQARHEGNVAWVNFSKNKE